MKKFRNIRSSERWVTDDDRAIPIHMMEEQHVRNSLSMIIRRLREGDEVCLVNGKVKFTTPYYHDLKDSNCMVMFGEY